LIIILGDWELMNGTIWLNSRFTIGLQSELIKNLTNQTKVERREFRKSKRTHRERDGRVGRR